MAVMTQAAAHGAVERSAGRPFVHADLEAMPDDGRRYEIVDGALIVTPAPSFQHQWCLRRLVRILEDAEPDPSWVLLFAPFEVRLGGSTLQPDLLIARRDEFTERDLPVAPALAVEVLSPSTRRVDLTVKRAVYEEAGVLAYWVVDPDPANPGLRAWERRDGSFVEVANIGGDEEFTTDVPYNIALRPSRLVYFPPSHGPGSVTDSEPR